MNRIYYKVTTESRGSALVRPNRRGKYFRQYFKGEIVRASEGSLGIFVFRKKSHAETFLADMEDTDPKQRYSILEVQCIGKKKTLKLVSAFCEKEKDLEAFYSRERLTNCDYLDTPPAGTMCFEAVKVLS